MIIDWTTNSIVRSKQTVQTWSAVLASTGSVRVRVVGGSCPDGSDDYVTTYTA